ncbi:S-methyl-5-thioribose-1-phosphate isomerase [Flavonifractor sp. An100]|uniref:S-methyl-5-thioribose-1-phosphate isomerase n=1 Tax=Flavonifractor sp. An100 TaxID=1965538 RepID=UPI000B39DDC5|nr:S-methyl-5-thioribose-1-phosphate isomerase [Flavonifractor sp. An100]OUQ75229.1 S-methyl-5-thioribose-1-phosphate isomerase [Flavonifractor sp. An100]
MENIAFGEGNSVQIIDQTRLPNETVCLRLTTPEEMYRAIHQLQVRGAPAIGIFAAYALSVLANQIQEEDFSPFYRRLQELGEYLDSARPTAANLHGMVTRMLDTAWVHREEPLAAVRSALREEARAIHREDMDMCRRISEFGLSLLKDGDGVLTHCNAGPLATSRYGTGQGPFYLAKEQGINLHVYCDETRPLLQGARLTSYELQKAGVPCTLICDNMASLVMKQGKVQACMVGCDRVALNGDAANKIGTSGVAILANYYGIPFYVLGPSTTIDFSCPTGDDIQIEERDPSEIREMFYEKPVALPQVECFNPAFDVTDHQLITAIVTERGICRPPYRESFQRMFPEYFGGKDK